MPRSRPIATPRRPPRSAAPDPKAVEAVAKRWEHRDEGEAPSPASATSKRRAVKASTRSAPPAKGVRVRKTDGAEMRATTVHLPVDLARRLAVYCAENDRKLSDVVAEALVRHLGRG